MNRPQTPSQVNTGTLGDIQALLTRVRDAKLLAVLNLIERNPLRCEFEALVQQARPRLRILRPARPLTLPRILVLPFEDCLDTGPDPKASTGIIQRGTLPVILRIATEPFDAEEKRQLQAVCDQATFNERQIVLTLGERIWPRAADALTKAGGASSRLGTAGAPANQIATAATMLRVAAPFVRGVLDLPPRPLPQLNEQQIRGLFTILAAMEKTIPGSAAIGFRALVARSAQPGQLLALITKQDLPLDTSAKFALQNDVAAVCIGQVCRETRQLSLTEGRDLGSLVEAALLNVARVTSLRALGLKNHAAALDRAYREIGAVVEKAAAEAANSVSIRDYLAGLANGQALSDRNGCVAAEANARELGKLRLIARDIGIEPTVRHAVNDVVTAVAKATEQGIGELAKTGHPPSDTRRLLIQQARMVELLLGSREASALLRSLRVR